MALLTLNFNSQFMSGNQNVNILMPDKPQNDSTHSFYSSKKKYKVLWLLHGTFGDYSDWIRKTNIERYVADKQMIVVMPGIGNADYRNWPTYALGINAEKYIIDELMPMIYNWLPASNKREDHFIAGLSMGGKGALSFSIKYPQLFSKTAILSFFPENMDKKINYFQNIYDSNLEELIQTDNEWHAKQRLYNCMHNLGSVENYINSDYNLLKKIKESDITTLPKLLFTCGTEDSLFKDKIEPFKQFIQENQINANIVLGPDNHEWNVWDRDIQIALDFFLQ